uniref:Uncharacterized protein n=1 Tax=Eutreptiella gymnastica TaxID=73025 RepID=A0A7S1I8B8_9EUGL|mmetsp:Transcript_138324/g.240490  ORF Transcript_138324/g.240490 Transcript_138324/m.240490 type:complete len:124 (+) Transcript_138324:70-441(+)
MLRSAKRIPRPSQCAVLWAALEGLGPCRGLVGGGGGGVGSGQEAGRVNTDMGSKEPKPEPPAPGKLSTQVEGRSVIKWRPGERGIRTGWQQQGLETHEGASPQGSGLGGGGGRQGQALSALPQ